MNSSIAMLRPVPTGCAGGVLGSSSTESSVLVWTRAHGGDSHVEAAMPPVSCRALSYDGLIVHHSSSR